MKWESIGSTDSYYGTITGYCVYRKSENSDWIEITRVTSTNYTDYDIETGKEYAYTVKAYEKTYSAEYYGDCYKDGLSIVVPNTYSVKWVNYDGTVLDAATYDYGNSPSPDAYTGETPVKTPDTKTYVFLGWTKSGETDVTYTATFSEADRLAETWFDDDGTILHSAYVDEHHEQSAPVKDADEQYTYTFEKWTDAADENGNITHTANYTTKVRSYDVIFTDGDGKELYRQSVEYGS